MQQIVFYGADIVTRDKRIKSDFDFSQYLVTEIGIEESIKIDTIRNLIRDLTLTTQKERLIYFRDASLLTLPAQQSLLKTLEEPPDKSTFILSVGNLNSLLATIRSRLVPIRVTAASIDKNQDALALVKSAFQLKSGERVQLADSFGKDRDTCLTWLDSLINSLYQVMQETKRGSGLQMLADLASLAISTRTDLSANVNVSLSMQHFFLSLPKTK